MSTRRIPIIATIIVVAAIAIMVRLGFWQLDRLDEKEAMIARFEANVSNAQIVDLAYLDHNYRDLVYRTVRLDCTQPTDWTAVAGRNSDDQLGYVHRYACTSTPNFQESMARADLLLMADIGWSQGPGQPEFTGGTVEGVLVELGDNYKVVSNAGLAGLAPIATPDPSNLPNNHLAYAVQWFLFALSALVIYILALRKRWR